MDFLVWAIFFLVLGIYLYFEWNEKSKETRRMKIFLMPSLFLSVFLFAKIRGIVFPFALGAALFLGFFGDLLVFDKNNKFFFAGGVLAFLAGHLFYAWIIYRITGGVNLFLFCFICIIYGRLMILFLNRYAKISGYLCLYCVYGVVILSMAAGSLMLLIDNPSKESFMIFAGAQLFMISDMGILKDFIKPRRWSPVILLYSAGQFLLALGIVLSSSI